jgi:hypothetical protein
MRQMRYTGGVSEDEVTLKQAAEARGIPLRTLQRAAKSKALDTREFGDMYATTLKAVDEWLADAHTRPGPKPGSGRARLSQERHAHGGNDGD